MTSSRVYLVTNSQTLQSRLVLAANPAQALRHCAVTVFKVSIPSTEAALFMQGDGVRLERAGKNDPPDLVEQAQAAAVSE